MACCGGDGKPTTPQEKKKRTPPLLVDNSQHELEDVEVGRTLGTGHFGTVSEGRYERQPVAIKSVKLQKKKKLNKMLEEGFEEEIRILGLANKASLRVTTLLGRTTLEDGRAGMVMKLYEGNVLESVKARPLLEEPKIFKKYAIDLAEALRDLHAANIVMRDVKPDNLLLDSDDRLVLSDFGIASVLEEPRKKRFMPGGNIRYMAPEAFYVKVTPKVDMWSYAATLIQMWDGVEPWGKLPDLRIKYNVNKKKRHIPIPKSMPKFYKVLLKKCFAPNPKGRPSAQKAFDYLRGKKVELPDTEDGEESMPEPGRRRRRKKGKRGKSRGKRRRALKGALSVSGSETLSTYEEYTGEEYDSQSEYGETSLSQYYGGTESGSSSSSHEKQSGSPKKSSRGKKSSGKKSSAGKKKSSRGKKSSGKSARGGGGKKSKSKSKSKSRSSSS